jgi:hypothetical protein
MRALFRSSVLWSLSTILLINIVFQSEVAASCGCLKRDQNQAKRAAAEAALRHLPSQSNLVTARMFVAEKLYADAAQMYIKAAEAIEKELEATQAGRLPEATTIPLDAISYLTEQAIGIENEASAFIERTGGEASKALHLREQSFKHILDFKDTDSAVRCRMARQLGSEFERTGDLTKAASYFRMLVQELEKTKGRYSPEVIAARNDCRRIAAHYSRVAQQ